MNAKQTIVAKISRWFPGNNPTASPINVRFEQVIESNHANGYTLKDWKYHAQHGTTEMTETIIAVFELNKTEP